MKNGNGSTREIVAKLWSLCHILRDDGITYSEYVTELTFLLFLKMLEETGHEERLPSAYRWKRLAKETGLEQLSYYRQLLLDLGVGVLDHIVQPALDGRNQELASVDLDALDEEAIGPLVLVGGAIEECRAGTLDRRRQLGVAGRLGPKDVDLDVRKVVGGATRHRAGQEHSPHLRVGGIGGRNALS